MVITTTMIYAKITTALTYLVRFQNNFVEPNIIQSPVDSNVNNIRPRKRSHANLESTPVDLDVKYPKHDLKRKHPDYDSDCNSSDIPYKNQKLNQGMKRKFVDRPHFNKRTKFNHWI